MTLLNIGSLLLGVFALALPIIHIYKKRIHTKNNYTSSKVLFSLSTCALALLLQIFYAYYLVIINDWSALMDIVRALSIVSSLLLISTVLLNLFALKVLNQNK